MDFLISNAYAQSGAPAGAGIIQMLPIILMVVVLYFLMIRPQQKRQKEHTAMISALKKGDEVVTNGGLGGKITGVEEGWVVVQISPGTEVRVQKHAVATLLPKGTLKGALKSE